MILKFQPKNLSLRFEFAVYLYFSVGQLLYGFIGILWIEGFHTELVAFWIIWPTFSFSAAMLLYRLIQRSLVLRCVTIVVLGVGAALTKYFYISTGIIDPVYIFLMTTICALMIAVYRGQFLFEQLDKVKNVNNFTEALIALLENINNNFRYFLSRAFQGFLALGASLGVSMSILFQGGFDNPELNFSAFKMLLGFVLIALALLFWIGIPMLNGIVQTQQKLLDLAVTNKQSSDRGSQASGER